MNVSRAVEVSRNRVLLCRIQDAIIVEETVLNCPDNEFLFGFDSELVVNLCTGCYEP